MTKYTVLYKLELDGQLKVEAVSEAEARRVFHRLTSRDYREGCEDDCGAPEIDSVFPSEEED